MPEIAEGMALLATLAETDEVKAETVRRQRLTQLNIGYGNYALRRAASARRKRKCLPRRASQSLAPGTRARTTSWSTGLWGYALPRGELPSMRGVRCGLPRRRRGGAYSDSPEACVAHRCAGATCWFV